MTRKMKDFKERIKENREKMNIDSVWADKRRGPDPKQLKAAVKFFEETAEILRGKYEIIGSCNKDISRYLIPIGTEKQVTYYGKPVFSFRISDHWSWYSSLKKCSDPDYIQCESADLPKAGGRNAPGKASDPINKLQVAVQGTDGKYHHVFGYKWDENEHNYQWVENAPMDVCKYLKLI